MSGADGLAARLAAFADDRGGHAVLSCDVFDTAVMRRLARPEDVLLLAGLRLRAAGLICLDPAAFVPLRRAAEAAARAEAEAAGRDEPTLAAIHARLAACSVVTDARAAARVEFEAERAACVAVPAVRDALAGFPGRVVFVSDTVLPGAWLAELLAGCGYPGPVVFTSADLGWSKHVGGLFPAVLERLGVDPASVVHLGDNPVSDVARARAAGLAAIHLPWTPPPPETADIAALDPLVRLAHSRRRARATPPAPAETFPPAGRFALLLIGFALFVRAEARRLGTRRVAFLARDGHLPLLLLRRLASELDATYLHVSRAAVVVAAASAEAAAARRYLEAAGFSAPGPRLLVDVGWRGSLQTALADLCDLAPGDVAGAYLGLWADALRPGLTPAVARGYLFGFGHPAALAERVREGYILFELVFSAPHGSVAGYDAVGAPVLAEEREPGAGRRAAALAAVEAAVMAEFEALDALLGGAWPEAMDPGSALHDLDGLLTRPTASDVAAVNLVPFIHGADGRENRPAVNPVPWHEWRHPRAVLRRLADAPWRSGAIRASLPGPLGAMPYADLRHRVTRLARLLRWPT